MFICLYVYIHVYICVYILNLYLNHDYLVYKMKFDNQSTVSFLCTIDIISVFLRIESPLRFPGAFLLLLSLLLLYY